MSFGSVKTRLKALINRRDFTDELAADFILDAMAELERDLRIGPMEFVLEKNDWDGTVRALGVPGHYLETISLFTDDGAYSLVDMDTFLGTHENFCGEPIYTRVADRWLLKPAPAQGTYVYLHCYGETPRPTTDAEKNVWTEAGKIATLYTAAALAADFYQMEPDHIAMYAQKGQQAADRLAGQALSEAWSGRITIGAPKGVGEY